MYKIVWIHEPKILLFFMRINVLIVILISTRVVFLRKWSHFLQFSPWLGTRKIVDMLSGSCKWGTISKYQNGMPNVARKAFNIGEVWNPVCCHGNRTVQLILWTKFSWILLQRIKYFWYKVAEISFSIIIDQSLVECMMPSLGWSAYF